MFYECITHILVMLCSLVSFQCTVKLKVFSDKVIIIKSSTWIVLTHVKFNLFLKHKLNELILFIINIELLFLNSFIMLPVRIDYVTTFNILNNNNEAR